MEINEVEEIMEVSDPVEIEAAEPVVEKEKATFKDIAISVLKRFASPVVVAATLTAIDNLINNGDFSNPKATISTILCFLIAVFGFINNPNDRSNF